MQRANRPVNRHLDAGNAARAKVNLHLAGLVYRTITDQPGIGLQQVAIFVNCRLQVRRAGFFFAFEEKLKCDLWLLAGSFHRVERNQNRFDGHLVVGRRARINPRFRIARRLF